MKRSAVILVGFVFVTVCSAAAQAARRPRERNYEATSAWDKRPGYNPTPPNNRPTGPIAGIYGTPGKSLAPQGAGNTLKSRVPYDKQRGGNGVYPDSFGGGTIGPGSRIGSYGSGQVGPVFPSSGAINGNSRFGKKASEEVESGPALPEGLQAALDDISTSWKKRDAKLIRARFPSQTPVSVFQDGTFSYDAPGADLAKQVAAGVEQLQTQKFELSSPVKVSPTRYFVPGNHTFLDAEGLKHSFYVSYVLEQANDRWLIAEYGVSQSPINRHSPKPAKEEAFAPGAN